MTTAGRLMLLACATALLGCAGRAEPGEGRFEAGALRTLTGGEVRQLLTGNTLIGSDVSFAPADLPFGEEVPVDAGGRVLLAAVVDGRGEGRANGIDSGTAAGEGSPGASSGGGPSSSAGGGSSSGGGSGQGGGVGDDGGGDDGGDD